MPQIGNIDWVLVAFMVLMLGMINWSTARMIDRRLGNMEDALQAMRQTLGDIQVTIRDALLTMNNTMAGIQRFLDRQERPRPGPAE
jgi:hypothetical protein